MAKTYSMKWEGAPNFRWRKMVRGKQYRITCDELGVERTKEGSRVAANEWLEKKLASANELDPKDAERFLASLPTEYKKYLDKPAAEKESIRSHIDRFLKIIEPTLKGQSLREVESHLRLISQESFFSATMSVESISPDTVLDHYAFLVGQKLESGTHNKRLGFFRRFVQHLHDSEVITAPRNLKLKSHRKKPTHKEIRQYDNVAEVVAALPDEPRLWALLSLNCGMTQADLGALDWDQVDLAKGTLWRYRVKFIDAADKIKDFASKSTYKLWAPVVELLRKLWTKGAKGLVFKTSTGGPIYRCWKDEKGKVHKNDYISTVWGRLENRPSISPGKFRNIGTTALNKVPAYVGYLEVYLANSAPDVTRRHYAGSHDTTFFTILDWLQTELGV